jgi:hypothetical protein
MVSEATTTWLVTGFSVTPSILPFLPMTFNHMPYVKVAAWVEIPNQFIEKVQTLKLKISYMTNMNYKYNQCES